MRRPVENASNINSISSHETGEKVVIVSILAFVLQEAEWGSAMHQNEEPVELPGLFLLAEIAFDQPVES